MYLSSWTHDKDVAKKLLGELCECEGDRARAGGRESELIVNWGDTVHRERKQYDWVR